MRIGFLITNPSLLLSPLEAMSEESPEFLVNETSDAISNWLETETRCDSEGMHCRPGKYAKLQLRPKGATGHHSPPHPLPSSPFSFILSHPSLKEPDFLVVMGCRRNTCHVPVSFMSAPSHLSKSPVRSYYHHLSQRLHQVFFCHVLKAYFMSESMLIQCCFFLFVSLDCVLLEGGGGNVSL